jgi:methylated-DNA-protein-cysteine methyltransferase-like protein
MVPSDDDAASRIARILAVVRAIPDGAVMSYGGVAASAGLPGRARLVARALAMVDEPGLPWHRVVAAGGRIALPAASEAGRVQRARLVAEGHRLVGDRLARSTGASRQELDALLWAPEAGAPPTTTVPGRRRAAGADGIGRRRRRV